MKRRTQKQTHRRRRNKSKTRRMRRTGVKRVQGGDASVNPSPTGSIDSVGWITVPDENEELLGMKKTNKIVNEFNYDEQKPKWWNPLKYFRRTKKGPKNYSTKDIVEFYNRPDSFVEDDLTPVSSPSSDIGVRRPLNADPGMVEPTAAASKPKSSWWSFWRTRNNNGPQPGSRYRFWPWRGGKSYRRHHRHHRRH